MSTKEAGDEGGARGSPPTDERHCRSRPALPGGGLHHRIEPSDLAIEIGDSRLRQGDLLRDRRSVMIDGVLRGGQCLQEHRCNSACSLTPRKYSVNQGVIFG
jgi:hypothetical protein